MSLLLAGKSVKAVSWTITAAVQTGESSPQQAVVDFRSNGRLLASSNPDSLWYSEQVVAIGNDYEIYASLISGTGVVGTFDAWVSLSANKLWTLERDSAGSVDATIEVSIRKAGGTVVMHIGQIAITAEVVV